jgi:hypothetical protein
VSANLSLPIQGAYLRNKEVVFRGPIILVMPILGLHMDLDQLENEAMPCFTETSKSSFFEVNPLACIDHEWQLEHASNMVALKMMTRCMVVKLHHLWCLLSHTIQIYAMLYFLFC